MRLTTRIALGLALVAGLLLGTVAYQLSVMEKVSGINHELSLTNLDAARLSVRLLQSLEGVREFAAKSAVLGDAGYRSQWEEWEGAMVADLARLTGLGLSGEEAQALGQVQESWVAYQGAADRLRGDPALLAELDGPLLALGERIEALIAANDEAILARAASSAAASARARTVAWLSAGGALLIAGLVSLLLFLSISGPLHRLTRGTREVARGRFSHRLEVSGPGELAGLARDFNQMAARLNELETLKQDFISHVSHELKTPLAAIQETIELFLDELPGPLNERQIRLMELSRSSAQRLAVMISNLLEMSRMEAGGATYQVDRNDLAEITASVLEEVEPLARERGIVLDSVSAPGSTVLLCDGQRIRDVVTNLVTNAVKFSPRDSRITAAISEWDVLPPFLPGNHRRKLQREPAPFVLLSVDDEGIGVPDEEKERIFQKFHQATRQQRIHGQGVGLGLAIAQRIVAAHGGAIWVEDREGGGSSFRVLLPVTPVRWRNVLPDGRGNGLREVPAERALAPVAAGAGQVQPIGRATGAAMLLFAVVPLLGCATTSTGEIVEARSEEASRVPVAFPVVTMPDPSASLSSAARLDQARTLLASGDFTEAERHLQQLVAGAVPAIRAEAYLGLAMSHLHPENPHADRTLAAGYLDILEEDFPGTFPALQAASLRGLLSEVARVENRVREQDAVLRELSEALDVLRRIDLQRRPTQNVRQDTLPEQLRDPPDHLR